jgi:hypothetical protein
LVKAADFAAVMPALTAPNFLHKIILRDRGISSHRYRPEGRLDRARQLGAVLARARIADLDQKAADVTTSTQPAGVRSASRWMSPTSSR